MKKLDIKTITIIVLGVALIISFLFGNKRQIDSHQDEITALHKSNDKLMLTNDSLTYVNNELYAEIKDINIKISDNEKKMADKEDEINRLKKKRNEVSNYINSLNGDGVSNAFSDYLNSHTKSNNNR